MAKTTRKRGKKAISAKNPQKTVGDQTKAAEYVGCLLELHKLQGLLLTHLHKEI